MYEFIVSEFYREMGSVDLNTYGILDFKNKIHTLGTDSKIIGRIFEMITQPVLEKIASEHNMILKTPKSQTVYPDFVMMTSEEANDKVAVDIKTTYIKHENSSIIAIQIDRRTKGDDAGECRARRRTKAY